MLKINRAKAKQTPDKGNKLKKIIQTNINFKGMVKYQNKYI